MTCLMLEICCCMYCSSSFVAQLSAANIIYTIGTWNGLMEYWNRVVDFDGHGMPTSLLYT